jgi:two-component sensor histidine kinase
VPIPSAEKIATSHTSVNDFNLLLNYRDSTRQLYRNDTIILNHNNLNIQFDVVNPKGYGRLAYMYRLAGKGEWQTLNNNELYLDNINADTYYDLQLIVKDNEWRSNPIPLKVYLVPRWWESYWGKRMVWLGILLGIIGIALGVSYFTRRVVNKRNKERNIQLELKSLKMAVELKSIYAQINPHFIFNTLSTGLYFIKKGMMKEAYTHITTFSDLLRSFLKASRNKYINLAEDIENLENYIKLQQTRFENKFEYRITVANDLNVKTAQIPSLLLQPIVENAIHHGLFHKEELGHLYISFEKLANEDGIVCTIDDDGIGRSQSKQLKEEAVTQTQSYGTDMVKELIDILNHNEPVLIQLEYTDKQLPDTGTTVTITIKYLNKNALQ